MVTYDDDTTIQNPEVRSTGILPVNSHSQDAHATILVITHYSVFIERSRHLRFLIFYHNDMTSKD